jgi:class 3 adenylate cyclase
MNITEEQIPKIYRDIIAEEIELFGEKRSITQYNEIPDTNDIPLDNKKHWLKIPDVICVFVDMKGSTLLSATEQDNFTAGAYQLFTGTAVRLLNAFEPAYIDVRGDGAFALFNKNQPYRAIAAAVSFKTFASCEFEKIIEEATELKVGYHIGIDQRTVLVRKIGLRRVNGRTDRQNEVWAGKPVNMAAKLAALSDGTEILVSDRYFKNIQHELVIKSCGCPNGTKVDLWHEKDLTEDKLFDFDTAYSLTSQWCSKHGKEYCEKIMKLDE